MLHTRQTASRDDPRVEQARHYVRDIEKILARTPHHLPIDGLEPISSGDRTATVTCEVDVRGDFIDLSIVNDWWHAVGPTGIAFAVLDALQAAQEKAMLAMALLRRHGRVTTSSATPDSLTADESSPVPPRDAAVEWVAAQAKVERGYALMRDADRLAELRDSPQSRVIRGPHGLFSLRLVGFTVLRGEVDPRALSPSDTEALADDVCAVLRQATREQKPAYWFTEAISR